MSGYFSYDSLRFLFHPRVSDCTKSQSLSELYLNLADKMDDIIPNDGFLKKKAMGSLVESYILANKAIANAHPTENSCCEPRPAKLACIDETFSSCNGAIHEYRIRRGESIVPLCDKHFGDRINVTRIG